MKPTDQPVAAEPRLDFEQRQRARLIAESRGIDLETAQELVYLRDKVSQTEPSSDARKVAREIVESYFMYSDRLLDKNALIDRIAAALTSTRSQLLKQIREAVEAVLHSAEAGPIRPDVLEAIDKVANETSET